MISTLSSRVRVPLTIGEEQVVLICRNPTPDELNRFLSNRFVAKGRKVEANLVQERIRLADAILVDVENIGYENANGELVPLTCATELSEADRAHAATMLGAPVANWKDLVNPAWKCSAAMRFEEPPSEGEGKN